MEELGMRLITSLLAGDEASAIETTLTLLAVLSADEVTVVRIGI